MSQRRAVFTPPTEVSDQPKEQISHAERVKRGLAVNVKERPTRLDWASQVALMVPRERKQLRSAGGLFPGVVPDRMVAKLKYGEALATTPATNFQFYNWVANGLYDPNYTGTGNQPTGFDQWMAFYQKFVVTKARFMFRSTGNTALNAFVWPDMTFGSGITTPAVIGKPLVKMDQYSGSGPSAVIQTEWLDLAQFLGLTIQELRANEDAWGTAAANPTTKVYWCTLVEASDQSTTITPRNLIQMEFEVEFFDRKPLDVS